MNTGWVIFIIILVLAIIVSNLLLLKKSAKFGLHKTKTKNDDNRAENDNKRDE
jgi:uncharacterized protein YpmB